MRVFRRLRLMRVSRVASPVLAVAMLAGVWAKSASAATSPVEGYWMTSYTVTMNQGTPDLTHILLFEGQNDDPYSKTWFFQASGDGQTTTIFNPFRISFEPLRALNVGLVTGLDGGADEHLVLMMNDDMADYAVGKGWSTLFGNASEEDLIAAVKAAGDSLWDFVGGPATMIPLGDDGTGSAWFDIGGSFKVVAFSDGRIIGNGSSQSNFFPSAAVPEPASLALAGLGALGVLAYAGKRRRAA